jgi:hypothetical protein
MEPEMKFEITSRLTGAVQFTAEIECADDAPRSVKIGLAVEWAIKFGANLSDANLSRANLSRANLSGANLSRANLSDANLSRANLSRANLSGADLSRADLSDADLCGANLYGANLSGANLSRANLSGANLYGANLSRADLSDANLSGANLYGANLSRANLSGANGIVDRLIDGGLRSDGYRFLLTRTEPGAWRVKAGCRNFTVEEALSHWAATRAGTPLGEETFALIDHMTRLATIREWRAEGEPARVEAAA